MNKKFILPVITIIVIVGGWWGLTTWQNSNDNSHYHIENSKQKNDSVAKQNENNIQVDFFIDKITPQNGWHVELEKDSSLLGAMQKINQDYQFNMEIKHYDKLGDMIIGMGELKNGQDNKYWQYEVNEKMPMVGAGDYILQSGDKVKWSFKKSEF